MSATASRIPTPLQRRPQSVGELLDFAREVSVLLGQPSLRVNITSSGGVLTLKVVNGAPRGEPCAGLFLLRVIVGTTAAGAPGGTQSVSVTAGTAGKVHTAGQDLEVLTTAAGEAQITVTGTGTRHVRVGVLAVLDGSGEVTL